MFKGLAEWLPEIITPRARPSVALHMLRSSCQHSKWLDAMPFLIWRSGLPLTIANLVRSLAKIIHTSSTRDKFLRLSARCLLRFPPLVRRDVSNTHTASCTSNASICYRQPANCERHARAARCLQCGVCTSARLGEYRFLSKAAHGKHLAAI